MLTLSQKDMIYKIFDKKINMLPFLLLNFKLLVKSYCDKLEYLNFLEIKLR